MRDTKESIEKIARKVLIEADEKNWRNTLKHIDRLLEDIKEVSYDFKPLEKDIENGMPRQLARAKHNYMPDAWEQLDEAFIFEVILIITICS